MTTFSTRRIQITKTLSLVTACLAAIWYVIACLIGMPVLSNFIGAATILFIITLLICVYGNLTVARVIYATTLNLSIALTASFIGKPGNVEFVLMFAMGLPYIMFSSRRERVYVLLFSILPVLLWVLLFVTDFNLFSDTHMDPEIARKYIYPVSILSNIFLVTYQLIHFTKINASYTAEIHDKREQALEASLAKSRFLSTMSHEIRTPLNAIVGLSYILRDMNPRKDQIENLDALNYSGKILLNLLNNVLDFSKMESTTIELDPIVTDIQAATRQIKKIHEASCLKNNISLNLEIDDDLPAVLLDVVRFNQVINNLVSNAIKFTHHGSVTLKISQQSSEGNQITLRTEVVDTGIGLSEEQQKSIWEAFSQATKSTTRLYGGTGLGLSIVKSIINAMGSEIHLESTPDVGSRFYFDINVDIADTQNSNDGDKENNDLNGLHILLVEDNEINVMVAKQVLENVNAKVSVATNGQEAVNMMALETTYDVVLMDIQMPIKDGYEAAKEIRLSNKTTPILALSASVFMEVRDKINECGMNGFIFKPFVPDDLLKEVKDAAGQTPSAY